MKDYRCISRKARERGSIGIFYPVQEIISAVSMYEAEDIFKAKYETHHFFVTEK